MTSPDAQLTPRTPLDAIFEEEVVMPVADAVVLDPRLSTLIEKARDWHYSDEWIGNAFRAIVGRSEGTPDR